MTAEKTFTQLVNELQAMEPAVVGNHSECKRCNGTGIEPSLAKQPHVQAILIYNQHISDKDWEIVKNVDGCLVECVTIIATVGSEGDLDEYVRRVFSGFLWPMFNQKGLSP